MKLRADDDIHRHQALWIDLRGWEMPIIARYVTWGVWFVIALILTLICHAVGVSWLRSVLFMGAASGFIMYVFVADRITNEIGLTAWIGMGVSEARGWWEHRNQPRPKPFTITHRTLVKASTIEPQPTWNPYLWVTRAVKENRENRSQGPDT